MVEQDGRKEMEQMDMEAFRKIAKYPLIKTSDMKSEDREEAVDICSTAVEKHADDMEKCTKIIKETLDAKLGGPWHCVVGPAFAFDVTHEIRNMAYMFIGANLGVLVWKL